MLDHGEIVSCQRGDDSSASASIGWTQQGKKPLETKLGSTCICFDPLLRVPRGWCPVFLKSISPNLGSELCPGFTVETMNPPLIFALVSRLSIALGDTSTRHLCFKRSKQCFSDFESCGVRLWWRSMFPFVDAMSCSLERSNDPFNEARGLQELSSGGAGA